MTVIGRKIGSYEVTALIGKGGMGEVYRAHDTKLKRDVAIKILPDEFSRDPDRLARFHREAEVLAALNHPHIAAIHDLQQVESSSFLILELVEGETLAEHIARGPLPLEEALRIAKQIAEALEAAHAKGIIHRDLKPENVKIKPDGNVKVLDFGLAKIFEPDSASVSSSRSPTLLSGTMGRVILGTAAYMSPEQARGQSVTDQSDIWSFGVVLYEMLAGKQAFTGDTITDVLAGIVKLDPDWAGLPATTPRAVRRLLRHCLQKNPSARLHHIADARIEIDAAEIQDTPNAQHGAKRSLLPWAIAAVCALVALGLAVVLRETTPPERTLRYTIAAPENSTLQSFAISPDGRFLAISALVNGKRQLWLRPFDALQAQPMPGTDDAAYPLWSPDSRYIAFFSQEKLKKISVSGGPPQFVCDAPSGRGGSWGTEDVIVFSPVTPTGAAIERVPARGGVPVEIITKLANSASPVFLPDGRHFLYTKTGVPTEDNGVYWSALDGSGNRRVLPDISHVLFSPSTPHSGAGHVLFIRENTLMALPFDAGSAQALGDVFPVAQSVFPGNYGYAPVTTSENGSFGDAGRWCCGVKSIGLVRPHRQTPRTHRRARANG